MYFSKADTKLSGHLSLLTLGFVLLRAQYNLSSFYVDSKGTFRFQQGFTKGQEMGIKPC